MCSFRNTTSSRVHRERALATAAPPARKLTRKAQPQSDERPECHLQRRHFKQSTPCLCLTTNASLTCMRTDTLTLSDVQAASSEESEDQWCRRARLAPPPVSPVPRHAITGFRAHRLAPPQTTRNCARAPKPQTLPKARQGKCCFLQLPNFKPRWRRTTRRQFTKALANARQESVLHLAAPPAQRSAPVQSDATPLQPVMPAEHRTAPGEAIVHTASRRTPTSSHAGCGSPPAS